MYYLSVTKNLRAPRIGVILPLVSGRNAVDAHVGTQRFGNKD